MSRRFACHCGKDFKSVRSLGLHSRWCDYSTPEARMWEAIDKDWPGGCWQWLGALQRDGYAHFNRDGKTQSIHRYLYERLVGPIPQNVDLLHSCDNRACVYPGHLRPGTHEENMAECVAKRRHAHGTRNHHAKLTEDQVREIRRLWVRTSYHKTNAKELSERFGVTTGTIHCIARRQIWEYVE